jgi:hypothetical protein
MVIKALFIGFSFQKKNEKAFSSSSSSSTCGETRQKAAVVQTSGHTKPNREKVNRISNNGRRRSISTRALYLMGYI